MKTEKIRRLHFKEGITIKDFRFENITNFCPITKREFHIENQFLREHRWGWKTPTNCRCAECHVILFKVRGIRTRNVLSQLYLRSRFTTR